MPHKKIKKVSWPWLATLLVIKIRFHIYREMFSLKTEKLSITLLWQEMKNKTFITLFPTKGTEFNKDYSPQPTPNGKLWQKVISSKVTSLLYYSSWVFKPHSCPNADINCLKLQCLHEILLRKYPLLDNRRNNEFLRDNARLYFKNCVG